MSGNNRYDRYDRYEDRGYNSRDYDNRDYDSQDYDYQEERRRRRARARRREEARRRRKRIFYIKAVLRLVVCILILVAIIVGIIFGIKKIVSHIKDNKEKSDRDKTSVEEMVDYAPEEDLTVEEIVPEIVEEPEEPEPILYSAQTTDETINGFPENVASVYGIFIDLETGNILRQVDAKTRMFPASMTKVLTALVACEHLTEEDLDNTFTMTSEINYYAYKNDCSTVGFLDDEVVTVRDLLYGTILPSGGEAAVALATYIAGDQETFVGMMNDKLAEMGLSETTHFTNCVGLYADDHYTTCYDMAMIMEAAIANEMCRDALHAHIYTTGSTAQHPNGIEVSNWFLRRIEDHVSGGEVYGAKTGFVNESGNCAVSYGIAANGKEYICVTGKSTSSWKCIKDHVAIYQTVFGESSTYNDIPDEGDAEDAAG